MRRLIRLPVIAFAALALAAGAACNGDDDTTAGTEDEPTTTSTTQADDGMSAEGVAATLDDLCTDVSEGLQAVSALQNDIAQADEAGDAVQILTERVDPVLESLDDVIALEAQDAEGQFQEVMQEIQDAIDTVQQAADAAGEGNFGQASDLLGQLQPQLMDIQAAAMDVNLDRCAAMAGNDATGEATTTTM